MANETVRLAEFAAGLRFEAIPPEVVRRAKHCIIDAVAVIIYGNALPWSRIIASYAERSGPGGRSRILGSTGPAVQAGAAALANGALAHAFEMDTLTKPGTGCHPGAALFVPALAVAQDQPARRLGGRDLITAVVAGAEVMLRIGHATLHSNEQRGFHAPGTTGPFGGAAAVGRLLGFDAATMTNALGIAGSLSCGLLEFARSGTGAMVKRLHLGRAAEIRRARCHPRRRRLHRSGERARGQGRVPAGALRQVRPRRAHARSRPRMGDADHADQALRLPHHRAYAAAGAGGAPSRPRLRTGRYRQDHRRRHRADGPTSTTSRSRPTG